MEPNAHRSYLTAQSFSWMIILVPLWFGCAGTVAPAALAVREARPSRRQSVAELQASCRADRWQACADLARRLDAGADGPRGRARALSLWRRACRGGHARSCAALGERLAHGSAAERPAAPQAFDRGCQLGLAPACRQLGEVLASGVGAPPWLGPAAKAFVRSCELGDASGCVRAAVARQWGRGLDHDLAGAKRDLERACRLGDGAGCVALGRAVEQGVGTTADPAAAYDIYHRAAAIFERGCAAHKPTACSALGGLLREGSGVPGDESRGLALQRRACRGGDASACSAWLSRGSKLVLAGDDMFATDVFAAACERGEPGACFMLGRIGAAPRLIAGRAPLDYDPFVRACELGSGAGCNAVGLRAVPPDPASGQALERACALGDAPGCYHLAMALALPGSRQDSDRAVVLLRRACRWRLGAACTQLGLAFGTGAGVAVDVQRAALHFERGCDFGDGHACLELGRMFLDGRRLTPEPARGRQLIVRACRVGEPAACARLGRAGLVGPAGPGREQAADLLADACRDGAPRACRDLASVRDRAATTSAVGGESARLIARAAQLSQRRCQAELALCYQHHAPVSMHRKWTRWAGQPAYLVQQYPACDATLERSCGDAVQLLRQRCHDHGPSCLAAAALLRQLAAVGLLADVADAAALEKVGLRAARAEGAAWRLDAGGSR